MSRMSDLHMQISEMLMDTDLSYSEIADRCEVPRGWVLEVALSLLNESIDSIDEMEK